MTRRFLDDVRTDLIAQLTTGNETPAPTLNGLLLDMIDSTIQDEAVIYGITPVDNHPTTTTFVPINVGYDVTVGGDAEFLKMNDASGEAQGATVAGYTYSIKGQITVIASNGQRYEFVILRNGVDQLGVVRGLTGDGNNDPVGVDLSGFTISALSDAVYTIGVRSPDGANDIDIQAIGLSATILPTNNP